jgi:hypothetical protein
MATISVVGCSSLLDEEAEHAASIGDMPSAASLDLSPPMVMASLGSINFMRIPTEVRCCTCLAAWRMTSRCLCMAPIAQQPTSQHGSSSVLVCAAPVSPCALTAAACTHAPQAAVEYLYNDFGIGGYGCDLLVEVKDVCSGGSTDTAAALSVHMRAPTMMPMADEPVLVKPTPVRGCP